MVQKQLYASHYYDGSLAVANVVGAAEGDRAGDVSDLRQPLARRSTEGRCSAVSSARSRSDQAKKSAEQTLGTIKRVLEQASDRGNL